MKTLRINLDLLCRLLASNVLFNEAVSQVQTLLALLEAILPSLGPSPEARSALAYERHFLYSLAWSIGGLLEAKDRGLFDNQLRSIRNEAMPLVSSAKSRIQMLIGTTTWALRIPDRFMPPILCKPGVHT